MNPRRPFVIVAAALLTPAFIALNADDGDMRDTPLAHAVGGMASVLAEGGPVPSVSIAGDASPSRIAFEAAGKPASAAAAPISPGVVSGDADSAVQLTAPAFVDQRSPHELVVGFRLPRGARQIEFTVSADPDLVELRDAIPGEWGVGSRESFDARVDEAENRIAVRIESERGVQREDSISLAIVRFEGVAAGSATITASAIIVRDAAGVPMPAGPASATTQLVVMSGPI